MIYDIYVYTNKMGKNTLEGFRKGQTIQRSQLYNEKTKTYIKRDAKTGKFMSAKKTPYKGVKKEKKNENKKIDL